jgi:hypothetical protein
MIRREQTESGMMSSEHNDEVGGRWTGVISGALCSKPSQSS